MDCPQRAPVNAKSIMVMMLAAGKGSRINAEPQAPCRTGARRGTFAHCRASWG
jgi:hypothetical protein